MTWGRARGGEIKPPCIPPFSEKGERGRPLRLRKGTRASVAMFAGDAWGERWQQAFGHPPSPLTLREGGRFLAALRNDMGMRFGMT